MDETGGVKVHDNGSGRNVIRFFNRQDNRLRVKARVQLNHIPGSTAAPVNEAFAYASCTNCQTFAIALQVDLISKTATTITPTNAAVAVNYRCSHCTTVARAMQYVYQVNDPNHSPENVRRLIAQMNRQLRAIRSEPSTSLPQAEARINTVIAQFQQLATSLNNQQSQKTDDTTPNAPPMPTVVPTTPGAGPTVGATPAATLTPAQ